MRKILRRERGQPERENEPAIKGLPHLGATSETAAKWV